MRGRDLSAVLPVYLIAVILRRIVAGGNIDTGDAVQSPHGEGELRRRTQRFKYIGLDAVGAQAQSRLVGKFGRHVAGIVSDGHSPLLHTQLADIIGQSLRRLSDRINIHAVGTCADNAAKAGCTKGQRRVETVLNLLLISPDGRNLCLGRLIEIGIGKPLFIRFLITHKCFLL